MKTLVTTVDGMKEDLKTVKLKLSSLSLSCADLTQKNQFNGDTVRVFCPE